MARSATVIQSVIFAVTVLVSIVGAQVDMCNSELPAVLSTNYSGLTCRPVWNNFILRYAQNKDNVLSIVLSTMYATGWVGIGFSNDGMMVGSSAIAGWIGKTGIPHIKQFYLSGKNTSDILVNRGDLVFTDVQPYVHYENARIYIAFQLELSEPVTQQNILFAIGSKIPVKNKLLKHDDKTSFVFDFSGSTTSMAWYAAYPYHLKRTHGALAIVGWGVLLPIGAIIARYGRQWDPLWFYLHAVIQLMGFLFGLAAVVAGKVLFDQLHATVYSHRGIGFFVLSLGILQVLAFFLRPSSDSKKRKFWNLYHQWVGRLAMFFAAINIVIGIQIGGAGFSWKMGYGFSLAIILATTIVLEILLWTGAPKKTEIPPSF